jgi:hypothetical protein
MQLCVTCQVFCCFCNDIQRICYVTDRPLCVSVYENTGKIILQLGNLTAFKDSAESSKVMTCGHRNVTLMLNVHDQTHGFECPCELFGFCRKNIFLFPKGASVLLRCLDSADQYLSTVGKAVKAQRGCTGIA